MTRSFSHLKWLWPHGLVPSTDGVLPGRFFASDLPTRRLESKLADLAEHVLRV